FERHPRGIQLGSHGAVEQHRSWRGQPLDKRTLHGLHGAQYAPNFVGLPLLRGYEVVDIQQGAYVGASLGFLISRVLSFALARRCPGFQTSWVFLSALARRFAPRGYSPLHPRSIE